MTQMPFSHIRFHVVECNASFSCKQIAMIRYGFFYSVPSGDLLPFESLKLWRINYAIGMLQDSVKKIPHWPTALGSKVTNNHLN